MKVVTFLLAMLLIGSIGLHLKESGSSFEVVEYDYSEQDSVFDQLAKSSGKLTEKSVDSDQELLDFRTDKLESETQSVLDLAEKSININTADIKLLSLLPGIGEKTAEKIVDLRNSMGKFTSIDDLLKVKGIGTKKFNKLKKYIIVE